MRLLKISNLLHYLAKKSKRHFFVEDGPSAHFDVDDTLVCWYDIPEDCPEDEIVNVTYRNLTDRLRINKYNVNLLKKLSIRHHKICVWSKGGSGWSRAVVKALNLEDYVDVIMSKPTYYIDDLKDPKEWIGKYQYYDINGKRHI